MRWRVSVPSITARANDSSKHNVSPNANGAGSVGKRTQPGVQDPIQYGRPSELHWSVCKHMQMVRSGRQGPMPKGIQYGRPCVCKHKNETVWTVRIIGLLEIVLHTSQSLHTIWCSPTPPHRDWLCDGVWMLSMGQWDIQRSVPYPNMEMEELHTYKFHFGMIWELHLHVAICGWNKSTKCQEREALKSHTHKKKKIE